VPRRRAARAPSSPVRRPSHRALFNALGVVVFVCSVFPVYWMVNLSFTPGNQIISRDPSLVPREPTLRNFITAWTRPAAPGQTDFPNALKTSLIIVILVVVCALFVAFLASIALARFRFRGRHAFIVGILVVQMIPGEAMMFTVYNLVDDMRLINTLLGLALVHVASVIRGFVAGVPIELEESAQIDGCSKPQAFWKVTFPLLAPGLVSTGIFAFMQSWNEFTMALLLMKAQNLTLPTWLNSFQSATEATNYGAVMAGSTLICIPVVIFFLIVQGRMTGGLVAGAVKG
jgi:N,N'-diacetylchitobiose transport system permease protein